MLTSNPSVCALSRVKQLSKAVATLSLLCAFFALAGCSGDSSPESGSAAANQSSSAIAVSTSSSANAAQLSVVINEAMPYTEVDLDEDREHSDWIELANQSSATIDLSGWTLSDDEQDPQKWLFPELELEPGALLRIWASDKDRRTLAQYRTLVPLGSEFAYTIPTADTQSDWITAETLDQDWSRGASGIGYGDNDDATDLGDDPVVSLFMRTEFSVTNPAAVEQLILHMDYDDGFIAYLNGVEIARQNLVAAAPFDALASGEREASFIAAGAIERFDVDLSAAPLLPGTNILAVQVHNAAEDSSDLSAIPILSALISGSAELGSTADPRLNLPDDSALHTNFKLSNNGETLYLFDGDQNLVHSLEVPELPLGASFGLPLGSQTPAIFTEPSPEASNSATGYRELSSSVLSFAYDGNSESGGTLTITGAANDETIRYTTDGSEPNLASPVYDGAIVIESNTAVRARAFHPNKAPSLTASKSIFVGLDHDLPVVSLITDPLKLFDMLYGIYVRGPIYEAAAPYFGANFWQDWERSAHLEFFEESGELGLAQDIGIKIFGGWTRANAQKSLALHARSRYGKGEFEYPFFPNRDYQNFENLVLRNSGNDWMSTMLRDAAMTSFMAGSGLDYQDYRPSVLYLNGEYWGIQNLREKVNEDFLAARHNLDPDEIDLLEYAGDVVEGSNEEYLALIDFVENNTLADNANYQIVADQVDIANFLNYQIAQIYFNNTDWPANNIKFWKSPETKWRWILYDTDFGFGNYGAQDYTQNTLVHATAVNGATRFNPPWATLLLRGLLENSEFQQQFISQIADELNTRFQADKVVAHINTLADAIASEIPDHYLRWGLNLPRDTEPTIENLTSYWQAELDVMHTFAQLRPTYLREQLLDYFDLEGLADIALEYDEDAGSVSINNRAIDLAPWNGVYFAGLPITISAIAQPGYDFSHWAHDLENTNATLTLVPDADQLIELNPIFIASASE